MNPKELRIGNFLTVSNNVLAISEIKKDCFCFCQQYIDEWEFLFNDYDVQPIQITEDWLKRFGFNGVENDHIKCKNIHLSYSSVFNRVFISDEDDDPQTVVGVNIKYVHQLQNLYFALTGEELEIKE